MIKLDAEYIDSTKHITKRMLDLANSLNTAEQIEDCQEQLRKHMTELAAEETDLIKWLVEEKKAAANYAHQKARLVERLEATKALLTKLRLRRLDCKNIMKAEKEVQ